MKRKVVLFTSILAMGIAIGLIWSQLVAQPLVQSVLLRTDLVGIEGKEAVILLSEVAASAVTPKHYHPGHQFGYVLEGSMILEMEGKPPVTYKPGDTYYEEPKVLHLAKNVSTTVPVKILNFSIVDKGQPLTVMAK